MDEARAMQKYISVHVKYSTQSDKTQQSRGILASLYIRALALTAAAAAAPGSVTSRTHMRDAPCAPLCP